MDDGTIYRFEWKASAGDEKLAVYLHTTMVHHSNDQPFSMTKEPFVSLAGAYVAPPAALNSGRRNVTAK